MLLQSIGFQQFAGRRLATGFVASNKLEKSVVPRNYWEQRDSQTDSF